MTSVSVEWLISMTYTATQNQNIPTRFCHISKILEQLTIITYIHNLRLYILRISDITV